MELQTSGSVPLTPVLLRISVCIRVMSLHDDGSVPVSLCPRAEKSSCVTITCAESTPVEGSSGSVPDTVDPAVTTTLTDDGAHVTYAKVQKSLPVQPSPGMAGGNACSTASVFVR
ncbi:hypothetical protein NESM_000913100 [Novymonas esmeraldas]|uniref:Uncharacterized protein n=1 Tax=Novymonas esmeraldas TaxID=1808958 RepID=A0AAW0EZN0_9TRYP